MPTLNLDFLVVPTYNTKTLGIADTSTYATTPPVVISPSLDITILSLGKVPGIPFNVQDLNVITSLTLNLTTTGNPLIAIPDGVYTIRYSIAPAYINYVEKTFMRVDQLQEKFDNAFMHLDIMECDRAIKAQAKTDLTSIYFFIQGAVAAANSCAVLESNKLYIQASKLLDRFNIDCGC
jgi:hypothetical protein